MSIHGERVETRLGKAACDKGNIMQSTDKGINRKAWINKAESVLQHSQLTLSQTTNFRPFQTQSLQTTILNSMNMKVLQIGRKHCRKRSNFSFSHSVF